MATIILIVITLLGCGYFCYDNIAFLVNFSSWVPDRRLNLAASLFMLSGSLVTLFNLGWLILTVITKRPLVRWLKLILRVTGVLSLFFGAALAILILAYFTRARITSHLALEGRVNLSTILLSFFTVSVIGSVVMLWKHGK